MTERKGLFAVPVICTVLHLCHQIEEMLAFNQLHTQFKETKFLESFGSSGKFTSLP